MTRFGVVAVAVVAATLTVGAQAPAPQGQPAVQLGALAPANLAKPRPKPAFDITGLWLHGGGQNNGFRFNPPEGARLTPSAQAHVDAARKAQAEGRPYRDDIGQCWPAGMPVILTRVWPIAMVQLPTVIYMTSEFMNSLRIIYLDGRPHADPDVVVATHNGESIGHWEKDTLVVSIRHFRGDHHWMDQGGMSIPAGEKLAITERIRMLPGGKQLEIAYTMVDPDNWEGEWKSTKRFNRVDDVDIQEVSCLPDLNEHLQSTRSKTQVSQ